jgi:two-component system, chemotaxis family, sensor kinase CheA
VTERVDLREFLGGFVAEAEELLVTANSTLLEIDGANATGQTRPRALKDLFRALHTMKGLAGMVGVEAIVEIAHALENLVRAAEQRGGKLQKPGIEVALGAIRAIGDRVRAVANREAVPPPPVELLAAIAAIDVGSGQLEAPPAISAKWDDRLAADEKRHVGGALERGAGVYTLTFTPSTDKQERGLTIASARARLGERGDVVKVVPRSVGRAVVFDVLVISDAPQSELAALVETDAIERLQRAEPPAADPDALRDDGSESSVSPFGRALVRVELSRLDELQEQLSQLLISKFRLEREVAQLQANGFDVRRLREIVQAQSRQLRDLRRAILRVRLIKITEVLEPLSLLIRSLARPNQREAQLVLDTGDAELDKAVADRLLPAIVHLVRNAVDHAIETPEQRIAAVKARTGTIRVSAGEIAGNQLALVIADDGRGIDRDAVAKRAGHSVDSDAALLEAIVVPGFSTRDVATRTSGRGVGMDVVKKIIVDQLGGQIELHTARGVGTRFTLRVPVTIAIVDVFSFVCGPQTFVVPVSVIDEIFELEPSQREHLSEIALMQRRGRAMPLVALGSLLAVDAGTSSRNALVVRRGDEPIAFAVDRMLGRQEVVVRPIDDPLARAPGVAGATDLGDGKPTLVLDLVELGARMSLRKPAVRA